MPPAAIGICPEVMMLAGNAGISAATIAAHTGTADAEPVPVCDRNSFAVVVLPANRAAAGVAFSYIMSPSVVIGLAKPAAELAQAGRPPTTVRT